MIHLNLLIKSNKTKLLLICGIIAALLNINIDIYSAFIWRDYSYLNQSVSELSAIGTPTRPLWVFMTFLINPLIILFGVGVWKTAKNKKISKVVGSLLILWGILGFVWLLFPMNMRGDIGTKTDTMHLVMAGITVLVILLIIGFGSLINGTLFRIYSLLTITAILCFGFITSLQVPQLAAQQPTPWMGVTERVSFYGPLIWVGVLAIALLNKKNYAK